MHDISWAGPVAILPRVQSLPTRIAEILVPARLGSSFRWLLAATLINNAADGIAIAAPAVTTA
jgi:hypothetical protein